MAGSLYFALVACCLLVASNEAKPQFGAFGIVPVMQFRQFPHMKMKFDEPKDIIEEEEAAAFPSIGFSLGGMDDRLKAAPAGLDRTLEEATGLGAGLGGMFGAGDDAPDASDVKTTIKNETKGNMKITTIDKKGKGFHMVQQVSEMKPDNSSGLMGGREEMTTMSSGSSSGGPITGGMIGFPAMGGMGGMGGLGGLGSLFGSILGGALMGGRVEEKKKKKPECSPKKPCPSGKFCDPSDSQCKALLLVGATCVMQGECDTGKSLICKWGKCNKAKAGDAGTFCKKNKDCQGDMSCNMRQEISVYYAICSPRLDVGSVCGRTNPMSGLFGGKQEEEEEDQDPDSNPCKKGLKCANVGTHGTKICVSLDVKMKTVEEEKKLLAQKEKKAEAAESGSGQNPEEEETDGPVPADGPTLPGESDPEEPANPPQKKKEKKEDKKNKTDKKMKADKKNKGKKTN